MDNLSSILLGKGPVFPIKIEDGTVPMDKGVTLIRHSIMNILFFPKRFRFFMGHYGGKIEHYLEQPLDEVTLDLIRESVIDSLATFEKRIQLNQVEVKSENDTAQLFLSYTIIKSNTRDSFIIPMYSRIRH